jgi:hypothetical protein
MKRPVLFLALMALILGALPAVAQSTEFGVIVGGSRRFVHAGKANPGDPTYIESNFSFDNSSVELFWGLKMEDDLWLKFKAGRIESAIAFADPANEEVRIDFPDGEVQHADVVAEYRFDEPYGSTGIFGGLGFYRQTAPGAESTSNFGFNVGLNADFPINRRYGVMLESTYHWTRAAFRPRYLTVGAGLRIGF